MPNVRARLEDVAPLLINPDCQFGRILPCHLGVSNHKADDFVEGMFIVVPDQRAILLLGHGVGSQLCMHVCLLLGDASVIRGVIQGVEYKVHCICNGSRH